MQDQQLPRSSKWTIYHDPSMCFFLIFLTLRLKLSCNGFCLHKLTIKDTNYSFVSKVKNLFIFKMLYFNGESKKHDRIVPLDKRLMARVKYSPNEPYTNSIYFSLWKTSISSILNLWVPAKKKKASLDPNNYKRCL